MTATRCAWPATLASRSTMPISGGSPCASAASEMSPPAYGPVWAWTIPASPPGSPMQRARWSRSKQSSPIPWSPSRRCPRWPVPFSPSGKLAFPCRALGRITSRGFTEVADAGPSLHSHSPLQLTEHFHTRSLFELSQQSGDVGVVGVITSVLQVGKQAQIDR